MVAAEMGEVKLLGTPRGNCGNGSSHWYMAQCQYHREWTCEFCSELRSMVSARFQIWSFQHQLYILIFFSINCSFEGTYTYSPFSDTPKYHTLIVLYPMRYPYYIPFHPKKIALIQPAMILQAHPSRSICLSFSSFRSLTLFHAEAIERMLHGYPLVNQHSYWKWPIYSGFSH